MPEAPNLHPLFVQLQTRYPTSGLLTELVQTHADYFVVRAIVQLGSVTLATSLATATTVEQAEDQARLRVLALLGIHAVTSGLPEIPFSNYSTPAMPLTSAFDMPQRPDTFDSVALQDIAAPSTSLAVAAAIAPLSTLPTLAFEPAPLTDTPNSPFSTASVEPSVESPSVAAPSVPEADLDTVNTSTEDAFTEDATLDRDDMPDDDVPYDDEPFEEPAPLVTAKSSGDRASVESTPTTAEETPKSKPRKPSASKEPPALETEPSGGVSRDLSSLISQIGVEIDRIGWSKRQGSTYLQKTYGKKTRSELTDDELEDFLTYLNTQPSAGAE
jgi:hypothetical protein